MAVDAVIFDLDGVLADSEPCWRSGFRAALGEFAIRAGAGAPELSDADLARFEGGRSKDTVRTLGVEFFPEIAADEGEVEAAAEVAIARAVEAFHDAPRLLAANVAVAHELADLGWVIAVASSSPVPFIEAVLAEAGLREVVRSVHSAYDLPVAKPDPMVYRNALAALDVQSDEAVAIEDSVTGATASVAAEIPTIWVPTHVAPSEAVVSTVDGGRGLLRVVQQLSVSEVVRTRARADAGE